jgi:hypothetical protein
MITVEHRRIHICRTFHLVEREVGAEGVFSVENAEEVV